MQSYSQDLRDRVLWALDRGERPTAIAQRLEVSRVWVYQVRGREQKTGKRTSFQIGGHRRSRVAGMEPVLRVWIEQEPGLSLAELCERLVGQGVSIKIGALSQESRLTRGEASEKANTLHGMCVIEVLTNSKHHHREGERWTQAYRN